MLIRQRLPLKSAEGFSDQKLQNKFNFERGEMLAPLKLVAIFNWF